MKTSILTAAVVFATSTFAFAQDTTTNQEIDRLLGDHTKYEAVINALQKAVDAHDAASVAELVSYPISVKVNGKKIRIKSTKAFVEHYDGIMTPEITKAVTDQKYQDLFVNYEGIMFGDGQVWISGICYEQRCKNFDAKVVTIQGGLKQ